MSWGGLKRVEIDDSGLQMSGSGWEWMGARFSITLFSNTVKNLKI